MIELPEFMNARIIERTYQRAMAMQNRTANDAYSRRMIEHGLRRARARDGKMLLFLEKGTEYLRQMNDAQKSRFAQQGYDQPNVEFTEFSTWREAYLLMLEPSHHADVKMDVFRWVYAAVAEALSA